MACCWHQAITVTNANLSSNVIRVPESKQGVLKDLIPNMYSETIFLNLLLHLPGANELNPREMGSF